MMMMMMNIQKHPKLQCQVFDFERVKTTKTNTTRKGIKSFTKLAKQTVQKAFQRSYHVIHW